MAAVSPEVSERDSKRDDMEKQVIIKVYEKLKKDLPDNVDDQPKENRIQPPFGRVNWKGFQRGRSTPCPFLTYKWNLPTEAETVDSEKEYYPGLIKFLKDGWRLKEPKLIISVVSGLKKSPLTSRKTFISAFKRTIAQVATLEGVWILTLGADKGTSEWIGEAVAEHISAEGEDIRPSIHLIGLCRYENIQEFYEMDPRSHTPNGASFRELTVLKTAWEKESQYLPLEPNHTHFIWVDTSRDQNSATGSTADYTWKIKLEDQLTQIKFWRDDENLNDTIPRVYILLNGGTRSLYQANDLLNKQQPIVVIKESNRAADLVAQLKYDPDGTLKLSDDEVMSILETDPQISNVTDKKITEVLKSIHEKADYITVYDFEDTISENAGLHRILLKALKDTEQMEASEHKRTERSARWKCVIDLARAWDCIDDKLISEVVVSNDEITMDLFSMALINENDTFVDKMLDHLGNKIMEYVKRFVNHSSTENNHSKLYEEAVKCTDWSSEFMKDLLSKYNPDNWIESAGERLSMFLGQEYLLPPLYGRHVPCCSSSCTYQKDAESDKTEGEKEEYIQYIFFWAVLFNRFSTAKTLLKYTKNPVVGALVGAAIYRGMEERSDRRGVEEVTGIFHTNAMKFEEMACDLLSICWEKNKNLTYQMLTAMMPEWGQKSALVIAFNNNQQMFMAHSASFTALNQVWRGSISLSTRSWRIVVFAIFPFLVGILKFDRRTLAQKKIIRDNSGTKEIHQQIKVGRSTGGDTISFRLAVREGYNVPFVRFLWSLVWSILFLSVYCMFVLCELCDPSTIYNTTSDWSSPVEQYQYFNISLYNQSDTWDFSYCHGIGIFELTTWCAIAALILEEIFQFFVKKESNNKTITAALLDWYVQDLWNVLELLNFAVFGVAVALRFSWTGGNFEWVRVAYAASLAGWFFRLFQTFYVIKSLGPKVTMIQNMVVDVAFFALILLIILFAFGVMFHGLLRPQARLSWKLFRDVLAKPYWQMYGELFLDEVVFGEDSTLVTGGLLVIYMILTNILLLNLLIAMFSHTFATVQEKAHILWRFNYYNLVDEYMEKSYIPPMSLFFQLIRSLRCKQRKKPFMRKNSDSIVKRIQDLLAVAMHDYNMKTSSVVDLSKTTVTTERRLGELLDDIHEFQNQISAVPGASTSIRPGTAAANRPSIPRDDLSREIKHLQNKIDEVSTTQKQTLEQINGLRRIITSKLDSSLI